VRYDAIVEIFKDPIQPLSEGPAHTRFFRAHEPDRKTALFLATGAGADNRLG